MRTRDPYHRYAGIYDRVFDSMNKGLKLVGIRLFRPSKGMRVLDVGCGTGSHLELYQRFGCELYGLDLSPSMLAVARKRLGDAAQLDLGDASQMPYQDDYFDLVVAMLTLHEMRPEIRTVVLREIKRVLKPDGRALLIDFQPGSVEPFQGWVSKLTIWISELLAGREHFRNYRQFVASGGLQALIAANNLTAEKQKVLAGGTFTVMLARPISEA